MGASHRHHARLQTERENEKLKFCMRGEEIELRDKRHPEPPRTTDSAREEEGEEANQTPHKVK